MKKRLDLILYELGFFETKSKAQANILAGNVKLDTTVLNKAGELFDEEKFRNELLEKIHISSLPYVSRGGLKLAHAIKNFNINLKGRICIDIGASTGGFCDCMLQSGASEVYGVDVGYNQMDWKIKTDKRVHNIEKVNAKNCGFEDIFGVESLNDDELPDFLSMDLSFISIKKVLGNVLNFISKNSELVLLIKPQFEAKREDIMKGGVVKDEDVHKEIIDDIKEFSVTLGLVPIDVIRSPIAGNKSGNTEYLIYLKRGQIE